MKKKYLGKPINSTHALNATFTRFNGINYMATTVSGFPAILNIYDLDNHRVAASFELCNSLNCWNHLVNEDGNLYLVSAGVLYRYSFSENDLKNYGRLFNERECFVTDKDEKGNIYIGSSPGGKVIKYDIESDSLYDLGQVTSGISYVRSISYCDGYIYCGVKGDSIPKFFKVNVNDFNDKKEIPLPFFSDGYLDNLKWIYTSKTVGDKIIIHCKSENSSPLLIFDTKIEEFIDSGYRGNFPGLFTSPEKDGKCYFADDGVLKEINLKDGKVSETGISDLKSTNTYSVDFIIHKSGCEVLAIFNNNDALIEFIDIKNKKSWTENLNLKSGSYYIQSMEAGDYENSDFCIYLSAYCGDNAVRYDFLTKEITDIKVGQCEGMVGFNGKQYMGVYPGNILYEYDYKKNKERPLLIGKMSEGQDRPFAMCKGDGKIFMGTVPDYGLRGGDIVIYDVETKHTEVIKEPVCGQSIISLFYLDGFLYGSTSTWGGLGAKPDKGSAKVFIIDVKSRKVVKEFTPVTDEILSPKWIGGVFPENKNTLWAVTGNTLMCIDPECEKVFKTAVIEKYEYSDTRHRWRPTYIRTDKKGNLYANILGIHKFNKDTMEYERITDEEDLVFLYTLDSKDNIYYAVGNEFYLIEAEGLK